MHHAQRLRARAAMCLDMASHINDPKTVELLKAQAAHYHAAAVSLESEPWTSIEDLQEAPRHS